MQKEIPTTNPTVETTPATPEPEVAKTTAPEGDSVPGDDTTKSDPFDAIEDPVLRDEAKKYRGIANRKQSKEHTAQPTQAPQSEYITREEIYADNRNKVIQSFENVADDDPQADYKREVDENFQDIMTFYIARNGQGSTEAIHKDIRAAYLIWKDETGGRADDSARDLQKTTIGQSTGGQQRPTKPATDVSDDPRFGKPKSPDKWYSKKED